MNNPAEMQVNRVSNAVLPAKATRHESKRYLIPSPARYHRQTVKPKEIKESMSLGDTGSA
jgi:hypothetical protein